jgi:hypothetical protein
VIYTFSGSKWLTAAQNCHALILLNLYCIMLKQQIIDSRLKTCFWNFHQNYEIAPTLITRKTWFGAFMATVCNEVFSSSHLCQYGVSVRHLEDFLYHQELMWQVLCLYDIYCPPTQPGPHGVYWMDSDGRRCCPSMDCAGNSWSSGINFIFFGSLICFITSRAGQYKQLRVNPKSPLKISLCGLPNKVLHVAYCSCQYCRVLEAYLVLRSATSNYPVW